MCQHKLGLRREVMRIQRIYAIHFNVKNLIKSMLATICNTYCIIQCKIQMICYINSQNLITVIMNFQNLYLNNWRPSNLCELNPIIFNMELTHLGP